MKKFLSIILLSIMIFSFITSNSISEAADIGTKAVACPYNGGSHKYSAVDSWTKYDVYIRNHLHNVGGVYFSCDVYGDVTSTEYKCGCGASYSRITNTKEDFHIHP